MHLENVDLPVEMSSLSCLQAEIYVYYSSGLEAAIWVLYFWSGHTGILVNQLNSMFKKLHSDISYAISFED